MIKKHQQPIPYASVSEAVKDISASQVAYIELDALPWPPGIVTVRDPEVIRLLLNGLRTAKMPKDGFHGRDDWISIYLKNGKLAGQFVFNADEPELCYSKDFIKGLKAAGISVGRKSENKLLHKRR